MQSQWIYYANDIIEFLEILSQLDPSSYISHNVDGYHRRYIKFFSNTDTNVCSFQIALYLVCFILGHPIQPSIQPTIHPTIHPSTAHDDVIKWKHFPCYWPFVRGIHWSLVNSPHKGQWRGALMFSLICAWINAWINNCGAGDLRRHRANYDVTVMPCLRVYMQARSGASKAHHLTCFYNDSALYSSTPSE